MRYGWPILLLVSSLGCERKAPGPQECLQFAYRAYGISDPSLLELRPGIADKIDDLIQRCLTTPFDRELIACVDANLPMRACLIEFQARRVTR